LFGARTSLRICRAGGAKSLGAACAAAAECRSGECYDRDFHVPNGQNRTYCAGTCNVNSDCGPDQTCTRLVVGNNGTPGDPLDDLVSGYCRTLFAPIATMACGTDAECVARQNGSDTCDVTHGLCYRKSAAPGSACASETDCPVGGECSTGPRFTGGYCQTFGCDAGAAPRIYTRPRASRSCAPGGGGAGALPARY